MWKWLPGDDESDTGLLRQRWHAVTAARAQEAVPALTEVDAARVQIGDMVIEATPKAIAEARQDLTNLVREVGGSSSVVVIYNAKNPSATPVLLISPDELSRRMSVARKARTLGQVVDALPFKSRIASTLDVSLPDDVAPDLSTSSQPSRPTKRTKAQEAAVRRASMQARGQS